MQNNDDLKELVKEKYSEIALKNKKDNASSCCGASGCSTEVYNIMSEKYDTLSGYSEDADLSLGCGLPTVFAHIKEGDTVVDLGSGAGNDCFVARAETGPSGKVIGVDFTPAMLERARQNALKLGFNNVEFREGDIENLPIISEVADVVVSNCVLNLVPDKKAVFSEIFRVLKKGGHFSISDIVLTGDIPAQLKNAAEMYAGCVSGAIDMKDYLGLIEDAGFINITIQKIKSITIPEDILSDYLTKDEFIHYASAESPIKSVTIYAEKPVKAEAGNASIPCC